MIKRLALIGVGLIGGSLVRALRGQNVVAEVVGYGRDRENLQRAVELGVIDEIATTVADAVTGADVVVVATPLGSMRSVFAEMADHLSSEVIITDVGSVKGSVVEDARTVFGAVPVRFIPGHPIAGTERSGVEASLTDLYQDRRVILTPLENSDPEALRVVTEMWQATGADVVEMNIEHHDKVLAATSHLPHLLAYALVDSLARQESHSEIFRFAAGGFRDFSRIASSNPTMWRDISLANREHLLQAIDLFQDELDQVKRMVRSEDGASLQELFSRAKQARDEHYE
ncbi:MAG: prephenate dehydrogenase/arogenate dehydrogenase family protein [Gammaproteobacteria bacterium]|uniref:prephenate dehydrogenase n=1 Tax=Candidatus Thiopontia autotrophica TaxID=2841688 RepID=A0A8J6P6U6_9GAMM|nr:prephenate dehydrogenase/arogenate dehydrogenase family protein [Candidatus Thiopontia autotrophica]MBL6968704.1 prephenate dehydrogenase/arogenate dehydrogenase family protein [Gammaproteobacteria bacterium]